MDAKTIADLQREAAELADKLRAVRAVLDVYAPANRMAVPPPSSILIEPNATEKPASPVEASAVDAAVVNRNVYAAAVRNAARTLILEMGNRPVPTRDVVTRVKEAGIQIRGQNELNAISALLSRNPEFSNIDRQGWVILTAGSNVGQGPDSNEAPNGDAAGASEAEEVGASSPDNEWQQLLGTR